MLLKKVFCIDLGTVEAEHGLMYVELSSFTKLSQIAHISAITGTKMNSLNNNAKIGPHNRIKLLVTYFKS